MFFSSEKGFLQTMKYEFHKDVKMDSLQAYRVYLVNCSQSFLLDHGYWTSAGEKALKDIVMVRLDSLLLKSLDEIGSCRALRICILADNFLTRIEALMDCTHLVKLDLKGNQIVQLPDASFWSHLKQLRLLYLHDNNMATWNNVEGLSGCLNLTALTLYDSPLSLKKNYRHCLVNNIWSLKALDNFVISDEEIIQNCSLPFQFKAMQQHFCVRLNSSTKSDSIETEMKAVYKIITAINRIQAFYSPTLIIQRWIRGHLIRKRLGLCSLKKQKVSEKPAENEQLSSQPQKMEEDTDGHHQLPKEKGEGNREITKLHVDLNKLIQAIYPESTNGKSFSDQQDVKPLINTPQNSLKSEVQLNTSDQVTSEVSNDETENFSVLGLKASVHQSEPLSDMLRSRKTAEHDIRHFHTQRPDPKSHSPPITSGKPVIGRCHVNICLTPFKIIEKAHQGFEKARMQRHLAEKVTECYIEREVAKGRRENFLEDRRSEVRLRHERERAEMEKSLSLQRAKLELDVHQARQKHSQFMEEKKRRMQEQEMVCSFSRKHNSLARVVLRCSTQKSADQQ